MSSVPYLGATAFLVIMLGFGIGYLFLWKLRNITSRQYQQIAESKIVHHLKQELEKECSLRNSAEENLERLRKMCAEQQSILKSKNLQLENESSRLRHQILANKDHNMEVQKSLSLLSSRVSDLECELTKTEAEKDLIVSQYTAITSEHSSAVEKINNLEERCKELISQLAKYTSTPVPQEEVMTAFHDRTSAYRTMPDESKEFQTFVDKEKQIYVDPQIASKGKSWFHIEGFQPDPFGIKIEDEYIDSEPPCVFRSRFISFRALEPQPKYAFDGKKIEGVLWILELEVLNLGNVPFDSHHLQNIFIIADSNGCLFPVSSFNLEVCDAWGEDTWQGLVRFGGCGGDLLPNIIARGILLFNLPSEESKYLIRLANSNGRILEMMS